MQHNLSENTLRQFTGTEQWFVNRLAPNVTYTEGVQHVAQEGDAYWLIISIAAKQKLPLFKNRDRQFWKLKVNKDRTAALTCEDGDMNVIYTETIEHTNFPIEEIRIWLADNVLLLPSEW